MSTQGKEIRREHCSVVEATAPALLFFHSTSGGVRGRGFDRVAAGVDREYFAHVRAVLQAVFAFELKLLGFELVTLLDEIVQSLLAADFDGAMSGHVAETLQNLAIKLQHDHLEVLLLEVPVPDHLFQGLLQRLTQRCKAINFRVLLCFHLSVRSREI